MSICYKAKKSYYRGKFEENFGMEVSGGAIAQVGPLSQFAGQPCVDLGEVAIVPGTVNTHTHSFQSLVRGFADDLSFFDWRDRGIYRVSEYLKTEDIYTGALFAFGEMLKNGVTTVCDFFYLQDGGNDNARAVIRAAKDLGIRLVLARCFYDWEKAPKKYRETKKEARERCLELMREYRGDEKVTVCPAPHSPHAASAEMIQAGYEVAVETDSLFHIHLAEGRYEVEEIQKKEGVSPLFYLDKLGVVTNKMVAVHCVWLNEEEIDLMAERDIKLSYNPSSNMFLGDGVTPIKQMLDRKITIGLGTDGACGNNKTSIFEEMRMAALLQKVHLLDSTAVTAEEAFQMGTSNGGHLLGLPIGKCEPGYKADFVTLNLNALELHPMENLHKNIVYSFSPSTIVEVFVQGEKLFSKEGLLKVPEKKIIEKIRRLTGGYV